MTTAQRDVEFSRRALELAARGIGLVSPNPLVGCVIVSASGEVVGEGSYTFDGVTHAEVIAIAMAGEKARGATAYVSLEPHAHHGKTPPCTDALIDAGIRRVVAPIEDPNPLVSGKGFQKLRESGIEVLTGILADEAAKLNEKFRVWHEKQRPFVHLKLAMSIDGRIAVDSTAPTALTGEPAKKRVHALRHEYDAILVGANTAFADDPLLTDRSGKPRRRPLVRVVLDNGLRIGPGQRLAKTASDIPTLVFSRSDDCQRIRDLENAGVEVIRNDARELAAVLQILKEREIQSVLVEGGSSVAAAFVESRLVDKFTSLVAPVVIGGEKAPAAVGGRGVSEISEALRLHDISVARLGDDIEITGYCRGS